MAAQDQSIVDLLKTALSDGQELIRSELVLAKTELRQEMSRIQVGIGAFAVAAVAAIVALGIDGRNPRVGNIGRIGLASVGRVRNRHAAHDYRGSCPCHYRASALLAATGHAADR